MCWASRRGLHGPHSQPPSVLSVTAADKTKKRLTEPEVADQQVALPRESPRLLPPALDLLGSASHHVRAQEQLRSPIVFMEVLHGHVEHNARDVVEGRVGVVRRVAVRVLLVDPRVRRVCPTDAADIRQGGGMEGAGC